MHTVTLRTSGPWVSARAGGKRSPVGRTPYRPLPLCSNRASKPACAQSISGTTDLVVCIRAGRGRGSRPTGCPDLLFTPPPGAGEGTDEPARIVGTAAGVVPARLHSDGRPRRVA